MLPVVELHTRIVHVRDMVPGQRFIDAEPKRRRLAFVSIGYTDGFPRSWNPTTTLHAIIGGVPLSRDCALFVRHARDRCHRFARCQSRMVR